MYTFELLFYRKTKYPSTAITSINTITTTTWLDGARMISCIVLFVDRVLLDVSQMLLSKPSNNCASSDNFVRELSCSFANVF